MDQLIKLFKDVENNIKHNVTCERDIFIVLHPGSTKKDLTGCGRHLIEIINGVRKSANVGTRDDYPNLVLVQTIDDVPEASENIVRWEGQVFGEKLAIRLEQIMRLLNSPTVYNPFVRRNGRLVNSYGPIAQILDSDPCGHELNHDSFKDSLHEVITRKSKNFTVFQTFVHGIFYSQYCDHCLLLLLNFMENSTVVSNFVWNLSRGVWSPKYHREMEQCFDWERDDGKQYKRNCWRLSEEEPPIENFSRLSLTSSDDLDCNWNINEGEQLICDDVRIDEEQFEIEEAVHNGYVDEVLIQQPSGSISRNSDNQEEKNNNLNDFGVDAIEISSSPIRSTTQRGGHEEAAKENPTDCSCVDMRNAYYSLRQFMREYEKKLPITRAPSKPLCFFCFEIHSDPSECFIKKTADIKANEELNKIFRRVKKFDVVFFANLESAIETRIEYWQKEHEEKEVEQEQPVVVEQTKPKSASVKRKASKRGKSRSKKQKITAEEEEAIAQEERKKMLIQRIVDAGFRTPKRKGNVLDNLPQCKTSWTRDHYRVAALGVNYCAMQNFKPQFLEDESGQMIEFEPVKVEVSEEESEDDIDMPSTSGVSPVANLSSSLNSTTLAPNDEDNEPQEVISNTFDEIVQLSSDDSSNNCCEDSVFERNEGSLDSTLPVLNTSKTVGNEYAGDADFGIAVEEPEIITIDSDDDIICLD